MLKGRFLINQNTYFTVFWYFHFLQKLFRGFRTFGKLCTQVQKLPLLASKIADDNDETFLKSKFLDLNFTSQYCNDAPGKSIVPSSNINNPTRQKQPVKSTSMPCR